jgi:hypothetical protein
MPKRVQVKIQENKVSNYMYLNVPKCAWHCIPKHGLYDFTKLEDGTLIYTPADQALDRKQQRRLEMPVIERKKYKNKKNKIEISSTVVQEAIQQKEEELKERIFDDNDNNVDVVVKSNVNDDNDDYW